MRRFRDRNGAAWDVVLGRESWGALYALFVPAGGRDGVRQTQLRTPSYEAAQRELDDSSEERLRELLERSEPKP